MFVEVIRALPRSIFFPGTRFPDTLGSINNSDLCENSSLHDTQAPPTRNWQLPHGGFSGNNFQPCKLTNEVAVSTLDRPRLKRGLTSSDRSSATKPKTFRRNYDNLDILKYQPLRKFQDRASFFEKFFSLLIESQYRIQFAKNWWSLLDVRGNVFVNTFFEDSILKG